MRTTGTPSFSLSFVASIARPRDFATSAMFRTSTVGRPISRTWLKRYRFRSMFDASTMQTTTSGVPTSATRPSSTFTATISSSVRGERLYVPGRSTRFTGWPPNFVRPIVFSTVTPG